MNLHQIFNLKVLFQSHDWSDNIASSAWMVIFDYAPYKPAVMPLKVESMNYCIKTRMLFLTDAVTSLYELQITY